MKADRATRWILIALAYAVLLAASSICSRVAHSAPIGLLLEQLSLAPAQAKPRQKRRIKRKKVRRIPARRAKAAVRGRPAARAGLPSTFSARAAVSVPGKFDHAFEAFAAVADPTPIKPRPVATVAIHPPPSVFPAAATGGVMMEGVTPPEPFAPTLRELALAFVMSGLLAGLIAHPFRFDLQRRRSLQCARAISFDLQPRRSLQWHHG